MSRRKKQAEWPARALSLDEMTELTLLEKNEAEFQTWVIETAVSYGWDKALIYHTQVSLGSRGGFPDLVLVRDRVIYWELKSESGVETEKQRKFIAALKAAGQEADFRYPHDWREIVESLSRPVAAGYVPVR